jgi:hypothetical protein
LGGLGWFKMIEILESVHVAKHNNYIEAVVEVLKPKCEQERLVVCIPKSSEEKETATRCLCLDLLIR